MSGSEVLRVFLSGERETVPERLKSLAERWAKEKVHFLDLSGTGVADLRPLSELTSLQVLSLERTRARTSRRCPS